MYKQKVLVSIDVEAPVGINGVDKLIYGRIGKAEYGINYIMNILDLYGIKGLFFVDIAEVWEYGAEKIKQAMLDIDKRGHDVGVHLHPDRMKDKDRKFLWQYSYEEQYEMISKCTIFYKEVLGRSPISFRAGRYGANNNTIDILKELGYKIDMSMFYGMEKRCRINQQYSTINSVKRIGGILEVPVTVFKSFDAFGYMRFDKIDESMPVGELIHVFDEMIKTESVSVASFFMHSFSFVDWRKDPDNPIYSIKNDRRIIMMLECLANNSACCFINEADIYKVSVNENNSILDTSRKFYSLYYAFLRAKKIIKEKIIRNI